jgi:hypothetical protein
VHLSLSIEVSLPGAGILRSIATTAREERKHPRENDGTLDPNHADASKLN